ncbi:hypothetical protein MMC17_006269 [Xylographa soralifera]|nr:hypothetical protein [Xylographa soralifera]
MHKLDAFLNLSPDIIGKHDVVHLRLFTVLLKHNDPVPLLRNLVRMLSLDIANLLLNGCVKPGGYVQWDEHDHVSQTVVTADPSIDSSTVCALLDFVKPFDDIMGPRTWVSALADAFMVQGLINSRLYRYPLPPELYRFDTDNVLAMYEEISRKLLDRRGKGEEEKPRKLISAAFIDTQKGVAICHDKSLVPVDIVSRLETARTAINFRVFHPQNWLSISERQKAGELDPGAKGPIWVSRTTLPPPEEDDVRQALFTTIDNLCTESETYTKPVSALVEAEWIGHRRNADANAPEPAITEKEKYHCLMNNVLSKVTLLYVHGGCFFSGSPAQSRSLVSQLTSSTHGRCFSLKYRLSPQHPFPSALLDLLLAYLHLLHPQAGPSIYHSDVPAHTLVITGDSVGANLCLGLIQTILSLARQQSRSPPMVRWNGADVPLHLPEGVALVSPWVDLTYSLPSFIQSQKTDYVPPFDPAWSLGFPQCSVWPTNPPRGDIYCDNSCLVHPLVNPAAVKEWRGSPPMLVICGEEASSDGVKVIVQQAFNQGVNVRWRQFEKLSHVFMILMGNLEHSRIALAEWADFCEEVTKDRNGLRGGAELIHVRDLSRKVVDIRKLTDLTRDSALVMMKRGRQKRGIVRRENGEWAKI